MYEDCEKVEKMHILEQRKQLYSTLSIGRLTVGRLASFQEEQRGNPFIAIFLTYNLPKHSFARPRNGSAVAQ